MILILLLLFFILLLIIPIPLKIDIIYIDTVFKIKIFKYELFSSDIGIKNKYLYNFINKNKRNQKKNLNKENLKKNKKKKLSLKKLYKNLSYNKFKPFLKLNGFLNFGIDDAAFCAIIYGLLCNFPFILNIILSKVFSLKKLDIKIIPKFNINTISFGITSIFYFNIANIIYIFYLIYKSLENKEVNPV